MKARFLFLVLLILFPKNSQAREALWLEGEACTNHTYNLHSWFCSTNDLDMRLCSPGIPEVSAGALLGHYSNIGTPAEAQFTATLAEAGSHTWWLRCNTYYSVQKYRIDGGAWQSMNQNGRETINLMKSGIDLRFLGWIKVCATNLNAGSHTFGVRVEPSNRPGSPGEAYGYIDCMCIANYDWAPAGAMAPGLEPPPGATNWWVLRPGDDPLSPASITDMSYLLDKPAGSHGFLQQVGPDFQFEDGIPVKFWGCDASIVDSSLMQQQARFYAKHGINLVRLHPAEGHLGVLLKNAGTGERYFDTNRLDQLDRWFAALKQEGIHSTWSLFYPHVITTNDTYAPDLYAELDASGSGKSTSGMVSFMQDLENSQCEYADKLLTHTNAYTGLAYKDDPALVIVEAHNEDCLFWHSPLNALADRGGACPKHSAALRSMWKSWVVVKYTNDVNLAAAWGAGKHAADSVTNANMDIYGAWEMAAAGPANPNEKHRMGDFIHFLADTQRGFFERRQSRLRSAGFRGVFVTTAWQVGGQAANAANIYCDGVGGAIDRHTYSGGGAGTHTIVTGAVNNVTHLGQPGTLQLSEAFQQVEDRPFTLSEWHMMPPNQWKAEAAPLFAFYGMGLHGWDASYDFNASEPWMRSGWPGLSCYVTETPHYLGQFPALALAVHKGHIRESPLVAARRLAENQIFRGYDALTQDLPEGGYPGVTNLVTPPEAAAIGRITVKIADGQSPSFKEDWTRYWHSASGTIDSITGELAWDYSNRFVLVKSPKTQGVIGWAGSRTHNLPDVTVNVTTPFAVILFTPLDNRLLRLSRHILITAMARDIQWNAEYSGDGTQLLKVGGPPLFLEPVQAGITFKGADIISAKAVDIYGVPTTQEIARAGNTITIDGNCQTCYYEVIRQPFPQPEITGPGLSNSVFFFAVTSLVSETTYAIQRSTTLQASSFVAFTNITITSGVERVIGYDGVSNQWDRMFYRLRYPPE